MASNSRTPLENRIDVESFKQLNLFTSGIVTATSHVMLEPAADGGSVVKMESTFKVLPNKIDKVEAVKSLSLEIASPVAAPRLFRAAVLDWHTLAPKVAPEVVASAHTVEGDGGVGSVRQFNFTSVMPFSFTKERLDFLDLDKCEAKSTLLEGGGNGVAIETASSHVKVEPAADGGSVVKVETTFKLLPGAKDEFTKAKESLTAIFKGAEAYLVANPDAYN